MEEFKTEEELIARLLLIPKTAQGVLFAKHGTISRRNIVIPGFKGRIIIIPCDDPWDVNFIESKITKLRPIPICEDTGGD